MVLAVTSWVDARAGRRTLTSGSTPRRRGRSWGSSFAPLAEADANNAYGSVLRATAADVQMVMIEGVPLYGDGALMQKLSAPSNLERVSVTNGSKSLATPAAGLTVSGLAATRQPVLQAEGTSLARFTEPGP